MIKTLKLFTFEHNADNTKYLGKDFGCSEVTVHLSWEAARVHPGPSVSHGETNFEVFVCCLLFFPLQKKFAEIFILS